MKVQYDCPLGSKCEKMLDEETIIRCRWWIKVIGKHPQTGDPVDTWDCSINWMPIMQSETSNKLRGLKAATESFRNESNKEQKIFNNLISSAIDHKKQIG